MTRCALTCLLLPLVAACGPGDPAPPDVAAIKAQAREELRAELEAQVRRELAREAEPPATLRPTLSEGERRAIAAAKHPSGGADEPSDGPVITLVPTQPDAGPAALTAADKAAAADDPATGKLPPAPAEGGDRTPPGRSDAHRAADRAAALPADPPPRPEPPQRPEPGLRPEPALRGDPSGPPLRAAEAPSAAAVAGGRELRPGVFVFSGRGAMRVSDLAIAAGVDGRVPAGVAAHFPTPPERLVCYTAIENREAEASVTHVWRRGSRVLSRVELRVGKSPSWRTWSRQRVRPELFGEWSCEILDGEGARLGLATFQVGPR
jgi:hypothetical protein